MTSTAEGTGWVHIPDAGWVFKQGDGHFFRQDTQEWVYRPDLLTPDAPPEPPPIPAQARARHAAGQAKERLTTGAVLPLEPTKKGRFKPWMIYMFTVWPVAVYLLDRNPPQPLLALVGTLAAIPALALIAIPVALLNHGAQRAIPATRKYTAIASETLHSKGWPTWRDAWGTKGHRPGGAGRGVLRGYLRAYGLGLGFLLVAAVLSGEGENMAVTVVYGVLFGVPALMAAGWLYAFRCHDFDHVKGFAFQAGFSLLLRGLLGSGRRQPYQPLRPTFQQPNRQPTGQPKPPWM